MLKQPNGTVKNDPRAFGFMFDGDAEPAPLPELIRGMLPKFGTGIAGGQSGAGKSFMLLDACVALGTGSTFFGHPVREQVASVYLAAEAQGLAARNLAAFTDKKLNDLLGLDGRRRAVLHLTMLGVAG